MDVNTFNDHLDRLGPVLETWPDELMAEAMALLEDSAAAADALADARTLANLLQAMPQVPAADHLAARISARTVSEDPWQHLLNWLGGALWRPMLAAGLPLAFGFTLGLLQVPGAADDEYLAAELGLLAFSTDYQEPADEQ